MPARCPICDADLQSNPLAPPPARCPRCNMALSADTPELPSPLSFGLPTARTPGQPPPVWTAPPTSPSQAPPQPAPQKPAQTPAYQDHGVRYAHDVGKKIRRQQLWNRLILFGFLTIAAVGAGTWYLGVSLLELFDKATAETVTALGSAREELIGPPTNLGDTEDPGVLDTILSGGADERVKGHYIERIEERDGKKVRIWTRRADTTPTAQDQDSAAPPAAAPTADKNAAPRTAAPDLTLQNAEGGSVSLRALRGKVVVLNVYANWCPPCRQEIPDFARFHTQDTARGGVALYGVLAQSGTNDKALELSRKMGVNYPITWGTPAAVRALGVNAFPTTIIIDREGRVAHTFRGAISYEQLKRAVQDAG